MAEAGPRAAGYVDERGFIPIYPPYPYRSGYYPKADAELDMGSLTVRCPACPSGVGGGVPVVDGDVRLQSVTARLNYRFGR